MNKLDMKVRVNNQAGMVAPVIIVLILMVVVGGYFILQGNNPLNQLVNPGNNSTNQLSQEEAGKEESIPSSEARIEISENGFLPETITVAKGQTVTWINADNLDHQIVSHSDSLELDSDVLKMNDEYSYMFEEVGIYNYNDRLNALKFKGIVIVK